jgi:hypothetical protein
LFSKRGADSKGLARLNFSENQSSGIESKGLSFLKRGSASPDFNAFKGPVFKRCVETKGLCLNTLNFRAFIQTSGFDCLIVFPISNGKGAGAGRGARPVVATDDTRRDP